MLRGWRLLQAAGLNAEEKRDILSTTKNSLDYSVISSALQSLWDDQLLGNHRHHGGAHNLHLADSFDHHAAYQHEMDDWWEDDAWGQDWWYEDAYTDHHHEDPWWEDEWPKEAHSMSEAPADPEMAAKLQEAQQAERVAESLAAEATRTWTEAQRATQALRRDRGFGLPSNATSGKCFICGGNHFARECPDRSHGGKGNKGYHRNYMTDMDENFAYYYVKGKSKGKFKGKSKKGMAMEAQAWMKGKGKAKGKGVGKDGPRSVNAYSSEFFLGGLEVSEVLEAAASHDVSSSPGTGMIDCGATASAAPEAVVRGLISAVLTQDKGAKIELEQSARPYFRFGNGRWGRALCRVHLSSHVSGGPRQFSLYALPNPDNYYRDGLDKSSLVPVLIGMDYIGQHGVGMMIDFASGLAMNTKETSPEPYRLQSNRKGHYVLDIVHYLTKGCVNHEGQAHVVVRSPSSVPSSPSYAQHGLMLGTLWLDMTVRDLELDEQELDAARARMWRLYNASRSLSCPTALSAQMLGTERAAIPSSTSSSRSDGVLDGGAARSGPGDCSAAGGVISGQGCQSQGQKQTKIVRFDKTNESRSSRPQNTDKSMAVLRTTPTGGTGSQSPRPMDQLQRVQSSSTLHSPEGFPGYLDANRECANGDQDAGRAAGTFGNDQAYGEDLSSCDEQGGCGGRSGEVDQGFAGAATNSSTNITHEHGMGNDRRRGAGGCVRKGESVKDLKTVMYKPRVPVYVGKKIMSMASLFTTLTSSLLLGLHLHERDGLWEVACAPHSWLTEAAEEQNLKPRRINLAQGYDLYQTSTWNQLRDLRQRHRPRRLWFSLPCTKWCAWTSVNYNTPERRDKLETARRRERRLLWQVNKFIKEATDEDPEIQVYFEWPHPCFGWKQAPMQDLERHLEHRGLPWLQCRIDGCNYGMKDQAGVNFLQKKWLIKTTDENFHRVFRAKVCPGNHGQHTYIQGNETAASAYYPWKLVQAIARHGRQHDVPQRHLRLLALRVDQPALGEDDWMDHGGDECGVTEFLDDLQVTEGELEGLTSSSGEQCVSAGELEGLTSSSSEQCVSAGVLDIDLARIRLHQGAFDLESLEAVLLAVSDKIYQTTSDHVRWGSHGRKAFVIGAYSHGNFGGITRRTQQMPELTKYANAVLRRHLPQATWTSIMISFNCPAMPHRDSHNHKGSTNYLLGLGPYSQGGLWVAGQHASLPPRRRKTPDGRLREGYVLPTYHRIVAFDPDSWHASEKWQGFRIAVSAYTTRKAVDLKPEERQYLLRMGFPMAMWNQPALLESHAATSSTDIVLPEGVTADEYKNWEAQIAKFHKTAGHPTNRNLGRIVQEAGHPTWKVDVALNHVCPACQSLKQGGTSSGQIPPASTHQQYAAWEAVGVDVGEWVVPSVRKKVKFVVFVDMATKLRVVHPLQKYELLEMKAESTKDIISSFSERWLSCFPKPRVLLLDSAKSLASEGMTDFASTINVLVHLVAEKEHWAHGTIEAAVQDIKHTASAIQLENLDQDPFITLYLATSALNSTEYTAGYSSFQWAFGKKYSMSDEDVRTFHNLGTDIDYAKLVVARQEAEAVAQKTRAKRVLSKLGNTTVRQPLRTYSPLDLVKVWRKVWPKDLHAGPRGGYRKSGRPHWIGPGRVVFTEVLPHQQPGDQRRHVVWVLIGSQLFRCSAHSVRPVTETEKFVYESADVDQPFEWKSLDDILPSKEYHDLIDHEPDPEEVELPDLPREPDHSTMVNPPKRRFRQKTRLSEETHGEDEQPGTVSSSSTTTKHQQDVNDYSTPEPKKLKTDETHGEEEQPGAVSSSSTTTKHQQDLNDYSTPEPKKLKTDDDRVQDLNWVELLYAEAGQETQEMDIFHAMDETEEFLKIEFDVGGDMSNRQKKQLLRNPVAFMVKKMRDSEVVLAKLPDHERQLFTRAKAKEVDSFITNEAVRKCKDNAEVRHAYTSNRIVKARWVLTWKQVPPEDREAARQDQHENPKTLHGRDGSVKAKARIVLLGFQHPSLLDPTFKTASPVQSSLGRHLLYSMAAHHQWDLEGLDLATAFLQTQPTEADQELWTTGVQELRDALDIGSEGIMRILRNIYGSTTAPRGLWLSLHKRLSELGAQPVLGERCLWVWLSKVIMDGDRPKVIGAMGGHVDDFHRIGDGSPEWLDIKEEIDGAYKWGMAKTGSYRHAGTDVTTVLDENKNKKIVVDQSYYIEAIMDVDIEADRIRTDEALNKHDVDACRTTLGVLQWAAIQTQPLLCARCNLLLTELVKIGTMAVAREIQALVGEVRQWSSKLEFRCFPTARHWSEVVFITMGDSAHANRPKGESTGGLITLIAGPECLTDEVCPMSLLSWRTWKLQRKAISSNDSEVQSILEGEDQNFRARMIWSELHGGGGRREVLPPRQDLVALMEEQVSRVRGVVCTDSRGGFDAVELNESPLLGLSNMRAALQAYQLRDSLNRCKSQLRWLPSDYNLGDALTKKRPDCRVGLQKFLAVYRWSIRFDPTFTAAKKGKKLGRCAVKAIDHHIEGETPASSIFFGVGATDPLVFDDANSVTPCIRLIRKGRPF